MTARGSSGKDEQTAHVTLQSVSADSWYRRLGHPHEAVLRAAAKIPETGVVLKDSLSGFDICAISISAQKKHPRRAEHRATMPQERVCTDLLGPVYPVAKGGFRYVSKFTDEFTRFKAVYLISRKDQAVDTLTRIVQELAVPIGLRVQNLRSDGGVEHRAHYYGSYCSLTGFRQEFTATNTPQQNGTSERDGRTLMNVTRCLLQRAGLPNFLWGEVCCSAAYLINRLPHATLGNDTPFCKFFGDQASLSHLRAVGSRAFVHVASLKIGG